MKDMTLIDDYGRRHVFKGERLTFEHTDTSDGRKPQWVEIGVWRTEGGNYVAQTVTCYRVRHVSEDCSRAEGYDLVEAGIQDTYPCKTCNKEDLPGGLSQASRITVEAYRTPQDLIQSFEQDGRQTNLSRAILADVSELDPAVDAAWNTVVVP